MKEERFVVDLTIKDGDDYVTVLTKCADAIADQLQYMVANIDIDGCGLSQMIVQRLVASMVDNGHYGCALNMLQVLLKEFDDAKAAHEATKTH
jgi:hypothetical protein